MKKVLLLIVFCSLVASFWVSRAPAWATFVTLTSEQLSADAELIVEGVIRNVTSRWEEEQTVIYTYVNVSVDEYVKGIGPNEITIRQLGGVVGDIGLYIEGTPEFEQGKRVLLYLRPSVSDCFEIVGLSQGEVSVEKSLETAFHEQRDHSLFVVVAFLPVFGLIKLRRKGIHRDLLCVSLVGLIFLSLFPVGVFAFTLKRPPYPGPGPDGILGTDDDATTGSWPANPTDSPPFQHWDHRRFAIGFEVPYSINFAGTPDLDDVTVVRPGGNGVLDTAPAGDDVIFGNTIGIGANGRADTDVNEAGADGIRGTADDIDDVQVVGLGYDGFGAEFEAIVRAFGAWESVEPSIIAFAEVSDPGRRGTLRQASVARDDWNVLSWEGDAGFEAALGNNYALTAVWREVGTGVILESDILFNDDYNWVTQCDGQSLTYTSLPLLDRSIDVQLVAMHEIGHFIGLHHVPAMDEDNSPFFNFPGPEDTDQNSNGVIDTTIMNPPTTYAIHALHADDQNGANFLYTPDIGDAPDPYPTKTHSGWFAGWLNGVPIFYPGIGAEHLFGYPQYQFEWLGPHVDNSPAECEARQVDNDLFDDGVVIWGDLVPGGWLMTTVTITTSGNFDAARYNVNNPSRVIYLNAWADWNGDNDWRDDGEKIIGTGSPTGTQKFAGPAPILMYGTRIPDWVECGDIWLRFRLDYAEDAGTCRQPWTDPTLDQGEGQAAFGEVEDYKTHLSCVPPFGIYLHSDSGLIDLTNPSFTYWHGICPNETYNKQYYLDSWLDDNDGNLSPRDYIYLHDFDTGQFEWYHVRNVTVTIYVESWPYGTESMFAEFRGDILGFPWEDPILTLWKEVHPHYCNGHQLEDWFDYGDPHFGVGDLITLRNRHTNEVTVYHVTNIATDVNVAPATQSGTICVRADGSVDPSSAPIDRSGETYTLTSSIIFNHYGGGIVIERDNIILDGAGNGIRGQGSGCGVSLNGRSNVTVRNMEIQAFGTGVFCYPSTDCIITDNDVVSNSMEGIGIGGFNNTISGNNALNNGDGIYLSGGAGNIVSENRLSLNERAGIYAFYSHSNVISSNLASNNGGAGILLQGNNNTVACNDISSNPTGIYVFDAYNNRIFHSNLIDNIEQTHLANDLNIWDNGYPFGGNYWSNYGGPDALRGRYQNETGSDGIGDTPYVISGEDEDRYPLMNPWTSSNIVVTDVTSHKRIVGQDSCVRINATIANQGKLAETFSVTVYLNSTPATTQKVVIVNESSVTVAFIWNSTGFALGCYSISVYAWPVLGETRTADNMLSDGLVFVSIPGDVNADQKVDLKDVFEVGKGFGSIRIGDSYWHTPQRTCCLHSLDCDINDDGKIDLKDYYATCKNYGKTW